MISVMSVSEFISQINGIVAGEFVVEGEVSSYKVSQGKWIYFDLKDESAVLSCFSTVYSLRQPLEDGMKVRVTGYPKIYEKTGRFSLNVQKAEMVGEGTLKKAYLLLKQKLAAEGLFAAERKRALSELPARVGVVASRDSAAFGDFVRIINNRWGGVEVWLYHVAVQGESAVGEITAAFEHFNKLDDQPEVLVLIRGGGSLEDLAAFNSEEVVRAVYGSKIPVIVGVGHERDESLADFAADVRASTPSNAAEIVVPDKREFTAQLDFTLDNVGGSLEHWLTKLRREMEQGLYAVTSRFEAPLQASRVLMSRFEGVFARLQNGLARQADFVHAAERLFNNVNPKRVLRRGYSIARDAAGHILRAASQVDAGDRIVVELSEGSIESEVLGKCRGARQAQLL